MTWTLWDLRSIFYDFSQQASSFVRSTALCSATLRRDLPLQLLNLYHIISAVTPLQAAAELEVAWLIFVSCVISIYLSIDLSVHLFASPTAAGFSCYTTAILLAATSQPKPSTCWRKWWPLSPNALACGRPPRASSPPSPTSSPSFSVKLIDCAHFLAHACMLHLLLLAR